MLISWRMAGRFKFYCMPSSFSSLHSSFSSPPLLLFCLFFLFRQKVFDLRKHLPLLILRRHCRFFLYMIRKSHDYDYLGAISFLFRFLFYFEGGVQQEDTTELLFYLLLLFIFWAAKEYGRTAYAQGIR